jgi:hypothetical protein
LAVAFHCHQRNLPDGLLQKMMLSSLNEHNITLIHDEPNFGSSNA